jgi:D-erythronate 2-dehydrogenase
MRVLVTGANGFVGAGLARALPALMPGISALTLSDLALGPVPAGATAMAGDMAEPDFLQALLEPGHDLVFHLASLPGARAEGDPDLGQRVNLTLPLALAQGVARRNPGARFVFASSIAVYGALQGAVDAHTMPRPALSYGAHKLMTEILLSDMTRRGELAACSLRLPGLVARPAAESGHGSAFMSQIFHKIAADTPYACPVPATARCWWMSRKACLDLLVQAARLAPGAASLVQPPVLVATTGDVAQAVAEVTGHAPQISWGADAALTRLFGTLPDLHAPEAEALGFRPDADLITLTENALEGQLP